MKEENSNLRKVSMDEILEAQRRDMVEKEEVERKKNMLRHERGLPPHMPDMGLDDFAWSQFEVNICPTTPISLSCTLSTKAARRSLDLIQVPLIAFLFKMLLLCFW